MKALAAALVLLAAGAHADPDLVLTGGAVYTLDPAHPWASALVVRDKHIAYVGNDSGARAFAHKDARMIVLHGQMVLPGFHDAHVHPMSAGLRLLQCRLGEAKTEADIAAAIRACNAKDRQAAWLQGAGWTPQAFGPAGPTRALLDAAAPDRPAFFRTPDGFTAWVNSKALALAGIDAKGPDNHGIARDPQSHEPTGVLRDDAIALVRQHIPKPTEAEHRAALKNTTAISNSFGVTSVFDASASAPMIDAYRAADQAHELTVRVVIAQLVDPARGPAQVDDFIARRDRIASPRVRADAAKFFLDGEIDRHTAAMLAPYADAPATSGPDIPADVLNPIVRRLDAEGFLIHMHVMGDRAVRTGLDALEDAARANGPRDRRPQLAHVGVADPADIPRFAKLGVAANFQPVWFRSDDPDMAPTKAALGPARSRWIMPIAAIASHGGRIVAGSDWPATSLNPLDGIEAAVTRDGPERVGLAQILAAYTRDAAWVVREDKIDGTIEVGQAADLVVLDRNLFKIKPSDIHNARVVLTLLDGGPVYRDAKFLKSMSSR
ncbi:MAG TPA: amidohydrolase [Rhizomicrobium sp.]|jgi:hypothetical protein